MEKQEIINGLYQQGLVGEALHMLDNRRKYWMSVGAYHTASAYDSAFNILLAAMMGNGEVLEQFNYYNLDD